MSESPARPLQIAVCAPGDAAPDVAALAEAVGRLIAERGCTLVCGGLGGGMAAACRGAKAAGGTTIGIIPGYDASAANSWVDHVICTGLGQARNALVAASGDALIAVGGGFGTLSEIAMGLRLGRPVVLLGAWADALATPEAGVALSGSSGRLLAAATPEAAAHSAVAAAARA
ncbi:MAG: TIGR00725 family protein [Thermomicrobiales bacterium]|nr:TIGR00725 family protein [Thermomicrobiales bacterium]